ncbi:MAG: hypothetical protein EOP06_30010 [Proteobacteria bacterium]|nr:MAG: hypothetical protein EOP06_30010 [Pseudomonadota bacterium]
MKAIPEDPSLLEQKIQETELKLERLEREIEEIGLPAGYELRRRLEALKIEERALKRNFEESKLRSEPDTLKMEKIETLLRHVEHEESSVRHDADFLHQAAPSSMGLAVQAGAHIVDLYRRGLKHVVGDHHLLGESVFVNHTHENLTKQYGLGDPVTPTPVKHVSDL